MLTQVIAGMLAAFSLGQATDTTFAVNRDARLSIDSRTGSIEVQAWDRSEIRVRSDGGAGNAVEVDRSGSLIRIRPSDFWEDEDVDLFLTIPTTMAVEISVGEGNVRVSGTRGTIEAETLEGNVWIQEAAGAVAVRTLEGNVELADVSGAVAVDNGEGNVVLSRVSGAIAVEGIEGEIQLLDIDSDAVDISTVEGNVWYDGSIHSNGRYRLVTHEGNVTFTVPEGAGLTVSVATFEGSLHPSFPITPRGGVDRLTEFTIGDGSARVELESFDGNIFLIRPGEREPPPPPIPPQSPE
jgi:DUF4097 and DUF4098 domain-containing protein YvlB